MRDEKKKNEKEKELVRYQHEQIIRDQKEEVISKLDTRFNLNYRLKRNHEK
jgi:hypothetical protein